MIPTVARGTEDRETFVQLLDDSLVSFRRQLVASAFPADGDEKGSVKNGRLGEKSGGNEIHQEGLFDSMIFRDMR